jgi:hypothetical protein
MKNFFLISILAAWNTIVNAQTANIAQPEMQIVYRGYDNKMIPNIPCGQQLDLIVEGATVQKASWTDGQGQTQVGYYLRVNGTARNVVVKMNGLDERGNIISTSIQNFHVKAFPAAQLQNNRISKSSGMRASVGLGPDCPFTGVSFEVIGGSLITENEELTFSGSVIPESYLAKVKTGKKIVVNVSYTRHGSAGTGVMTCSSVVEVVP